jgi:hypothetical protein
MSSSVDSFHPDIQARPVKAEAGRGRAPMQAPKVALNPKINARAGSAVGLSFPPMDSFSPTTMS